jgi:hypothetical protein
MYGPVVTDGPGKTLIHEGYLRGLAIDDLI